MSNVFFFKRNSLVQYGAALSEMADKCVWVVVSIHIQLVPASIIQWMLNDISSGLFDAQS